MSEMITKLTPEQEASIPEFRKKWLDRATVETWDPERARAAVPGVYTNGNAKPPEAVFCWDSPGPVYTAIHIMRIREGLDKPNRTKNRPPLQYVKEAVDELSRAGGFTKTELRELVKGAREPKDWRVEPSEGARWCTWRAFYDFFHHHFGLAKVLEPVFELDQSGAFAWWFFDRYAFLCGPPKMKFRRAPDYTPILHCDGGPTWLWPNGQALWYLNGVDVPQWLAETPAERLDPKQILKLENVEQRREGIRKIGPELFMQRLGSTCVDRETLCGSPYELHEFDLGAPVGRARALKMLNPSIGTYHVEFVPPGTKTVRAALEFRNGTTELPEVLH